MLDKEKRAAYLKREEDLERNRHIVEILLDVIKFLGRQGLAFRSHGKEEDGNFRQTVNLLLLLAFDAEICISSSLRNMYQWCKFQENLNGWV